MSIFRILDKNELDGYDCFLLFDYYSKLACITDFAIASGTMPYVNNDDLRTGMYWINDSNELDYDYAFVISDEGKIYSCRKNNKYHVGVRVASKYSDIKKYLTSEIQVDGNLYVGEMGYFPKEVTKLNNRNVYNTGISFELSCFEEGSFNTFNLVNTPIYENNGDYILKYESQQVFANLSDNQTYFNHEDIVFKLEPIRMWIDKEHDLALSQDVILGGVAYMSGLGEKEYDDYDESDIAKLLEIFENNIEKSMKLYDKSKVKKKRYM